MKAYGFVLVGNALEVYWKGLGNPFPTKFQ